MPAETVHEAAERLEEVAEASRAKAHAAVWRTERVGAPADELLALAAVDAHLALVARLRAGVQCYGDTTGRI